MSSPHTHRAADSAAARVSARQAIAAVTSDFTELPEPVGAGRPDGPLAWSGYDDARAAAYERTGETESVVCGTAVVEGVRAVLVSFEFRYLGGSLGERTGDRLEAAYAAARAHRLPLVSLVATGGSRMQEGMRALSQLQRVAAQSALNRAAGLPQIAVVRDPTTGGGWATLGAGADVVLALPGAQVGFAGSRVRPPDADPSAYTAEGQLAAGAVDAVVPADRLRTRLGRWLRLLGSPARGPVAPPRALGDARPPGTGWEAVLRARSPERPRAAAYLDAYFSWREQISGDRCGGTDAGLLCGFGLREGRSVAYAAQCGTATRPAGYRTAARLIRLADRLSVPVLTLIDTPGAANDAEAERAGAGAAIADVFAAVAAARTPVTSLVIGEGGSGGALALAAPGRTWAAPDSYFSVIAPEAAAAILKRPRADAPGLAEELRLRPRDLVDLGVVRGIVGH
ncbi:carboxyl transferase domain-containing protein [Streptomyces spectabilis]|uniref:Acetyl-coenzyme A carboxylase carboxyl transferase subunits beta/alpha n=1 Tax=Streptomyces spectabilis TaxID=68270 RepID=A0A5P2XLP7_STRST|nr:carboxyl transferase domain-containing protein [Streptomyces spectabilis]MBB5102267.1 acetyl-CoA carboxylase carboxyl transferase subunit beta [Streptomyces spectabilis]MCI3907315.1 acetyl-CoA carboxylase [Streptomyces spectabilis]QEV64045.1 acetyl-CoA carboxylase [Streptomyces spectabilis]GGV29805.1 acetyl-CoA carboxylase [Streptomyces spectabilis]